MSVERPPRLGAAWRGPRIRRREPVLRRLDWTFPAPPLTRRELVSALPDRPSARPPVLLVHGAWHAAWCWQEHWMPAMAARGWEVHALSLRAHGGSEAPANRALIPIRHYEHDVLQAITTLERPPILIGHSMGGLIVQHVLARYSAAPAGVLLAPVPPRHHGGALDAVGRADPLALARALVGLHPRPRTTTMFGSATDPADAARWAARLEPEPWLATLQLVLPRPSHEPSQPVLVIGGGEDRLTPPHAVARTARELGTRAHLFPGMGHQLMLEPGWESVLDLALGWLDDVLIGA